MGNTKVWKTEEYVATKSDYALDQSGNWNRKREKENLASDENNRAYIENYEKEHQDRINEMTAQMGACAGDGAGTKIRSAGV